MATTPKKRIPELPYIIGFVLSLLFTFGAYILVSQHVKGHHAYLSHEFLIGAILTFAMLQLIVQLVFFLHIGREDKPRWNAWVLAFAVLVVTILVVGSIWIMKNLDYSHGTHQDSIDTTIIEDEGFTAPTEHDSEEYSH